MKLHLTHSLRCLLKRSMIPSSVLAFSLSALPGLGVYIEPEPPIALTGDIVWENGAGSGYTGEKNVWYSAENAVWNINSGAYQVSNHVEGLGDDEDTTVYGVSLNQSSLTNSAQVNAQVSVYQSSPIYSSTERGIQVCNNSSLVNTEQGVISVIAAARGSAENSSDDVVSAAPIFPGDDGSSSEISSIPNYYKTRHTQQAMSLQDSICENRGTISLVSRSVDEDDFVYACSGKNTGLLMFDDSKLNNSGVVKVNIDDGIEAIGVDLREAGTKIYNTGTIDIQVGDREQRMTRYAYGIYSRPIGGGTLREIINQGNINVSVEGRWAQLRYDEDGDPICETSGAADGITLSRVSVQNKEGASITTHAVVDAQSHFSSRGMFLRDNSLLVNDKGASITATAATYGSPGWSYPGVAGIDVHDYSMLINHGTLRATAEDREGTHSVPPINGVAIRAHSSVVNTGVLAANRVYLLEEGAQLKLLDGSTIMNYDPTGPYLAILADSGTTDRTLSLGGVLVGSPVYNDSTGHGNFGTYVASKSGGSVITVVDELAIGYVEMTLVGDVTLKMEDNLFVWATTTHDWKGNSLTVDNGGSMHTVGIDSMSFNTSGKMVFTEANGRVSVESIVGGTTSVSNGVVQTAGGLNVGSREEATVVKSGTDSLSLSAGQGGMVMNTTLEAETISVSGSSEAEVTLDSVTMKGSSVSLSNAEVRGDSSFSGVLTLNVAGVTFVLDSSNSIGIGVQPAAMLMSADPLTQTEVASNVFYINSDMLARVNVSGSMTLDLSSWADAIQAGGYEGVGIMFGGNTAFAATAEITATLDGITFATPYQVENGTFYFTSLSLGLSPTASIPEPSAATLSLLALTALAARRRRK